MKTILIIEDMGRQSYILKFDLSKLGYNILIAETGEKGLTLAISSKPDLIILDIMLPGMDGYTVCMNIRSHPEISQIPVIMTSALSDRKAIEKGLNSGATYYLVKPFKFEKLNQVIVRYTGEA
ncbi:MAG: response regulator [Candidatus Aureabacteria bacterium]|nr:response regulator [Candidatus Auribacterota bacterium]